MVMARLTVECSRAADYNAASAYLAGAQTTTVPRRYSAQSDTGNGSGEPYCRRASLIHYRPIWGLPSKFKRGASTNSFFTIGHSTRTIGEFVDLLRESSVDFVVDVRSMPRSRTNPQFNGDSLPTALAPWQIGYEHIAALGGLRGRARGAEPSPNGYWRVRSFRNYADYAVTEPFAAGLARLCELGMRHRCAIMCAEAVWWRCHRRIIADYLLANGEQVLHILGAGHVETASLTPGAVRRQDGTIVYPENGPAAP